MLINRSETGQAHEQTPDHGHCYGPDLLDPFIMIINWSDCFLSQYFKPIQPLSKF